CPPARSGSRHRQGAGVESVRSSQFAVLSSPCESKSFDPDTSPGFGRGFCCPESAADGGTWTDSGLLPTLCGSFPRVLFAGCGIEDRTDSRNGICRESALLSVLANCFLIRGDVDAVNLVVGDKALDPLNAGPNGLHHRAGLLRDGVQLIRGQLSGPGNLSLDHEFWH